MRRGVRAMIMSVSALLNEVRGFKPDFRRVYCSELCRDCSGHRQARVLQEALSGEQVRTANTQCLHEKCSREVYQTSPIYHLSKLPKRHFDDRDVLLLVG